MTASKRVIEWAPFELRAGVDEGRLMQASAALQTEFLSKQDGFIQRELFKGIENQWVDLVYWESMADAQQAAQNAANSSVCYAYFQLMVGGDHIDPAADVQHFEHVRSYTSETALIAG